MLSNLTRELVTTVAELEAAVADRNRMIDGQQQRWDSLVGSIHTDGRALSFQDRIERLEGEIDWHSKGRVLPLTTPPTPAPPPPPPSGWVLPDPTGHLMTMTGHAKRGREEGPPHYPAPPRQGVQRYSEAPVPNAPYSQQPPPPPPNYLGGTQMFSGPPPVPFQQQQQQPFRTEPKGTGDNKFKLKMCSHYSVGMTCPHGERCTFAHGEHELGTPKPSADNHRPPPQRRPPSPPRQRSPRASREPNVLFKSKLCNNFLSGKVCHHGARCTFAHGEADLATGTIASPTLPPVMGGHRAPNPRRDRSPRREGARRERSRGRRESPASPDLPNRTSPGRSDPHPDRRLYPRECMTCKEKVVGSFADHNRRLHSELRVHQPWHAPENRLGPQGTLTLTQGAPPPRPEDSEGHPTSPTVPSISGA